MIIKNEYKKFAESVVQMKRIQLDVYTNKVELEINRFFMWIMEQIVFKLDESGHYKREHNLVLSAGLIEYNKRVRVQNGLGAEYWSSFGITPEDFFSIMRMLAEYIETIPNYRVKFMQEQESNVALLNISVSI